MREKILTRSGIYMIKNIENGKFYIGSAIDFSKRIEKELKLMNKEKDNGGN